MNISVHSSDVGLSRRQKRDFTLASPTGGGFRRRDNGYFPSHTAPGGIALPSGSMAAGDMFKGFQGLGFQHRKGLALDFREFRAGLVLHQTRPGQIHAHFFS